MLYGSSILKSGINERIAITFFQGREQTSTAKRRLNSIFSEVFPCDEEMMCSEWQNSFMAVYLNAVSTSGRRSFQMLIHSCLSFRKSLDFCKTSIDLEHIQKAI